MGGLSWIHWLILIAVVLLLFGGRGKISSVMGDFAQGINAFKKGLKNDKDEEVAKTSTERKPTETIERG
jgi:sec-independent protein translocase protein TatA